LVSIHSVLYSHTLGCAESSRSLFKVLINSFLFTPALNPEEVFWICVSFSVEEELSFLAFQLDKKCILGDIEIMKLR
jgi:hypothetical protein